MAYKSENIDAQALKEAAKAGATWKDLAAYIGVSERTLRRWRKEGYEDILPMEPARGMFISRSGPEPGEIADILAIIYAGRAEGRQEILASIQKQAAQQNNLWAQLALLKRLDRLDE